MNMDSYDTQELYDQKSSMVQTCFQLANGARPIHTCNEVNIVHSNLFFTFFSADSNIISNIHIFYFFRDNPSFIKSL